MSQCVHDPNSLSPRHSQPASLPRCQQRHARSVGSNAALSVYSPSRVDMVSRAKSYTYGQSCEPFGHEGGYDENARRAPDLRPPHRASTTPPMHAPSATALPRKPQKRHGQTVRANAALIGYSPSRVDMVSHSTSGTYTQSGATAYPQQRHRPHA